MKTLRRKECKSKHIFHERWRLKECPYITRGAVFFKAPFLYFWPIFFSSFGLIDCAELLRFSPFSLDCLESSRFGGGKQSGGYKYNKEMEDCFTVKKIKINSEKQQHRSTLKVRLCDCDNKDSTYAHQSWNRNLWNCMKRSTLMLMMLCKHMSPLGLEGSC